jgi:hypothetical protein
MAAIVSVDFTFKGELQKSIIIDDPATIDINEI